MSAWPCLQAYANSKRLICPHAVHKHLHSKYQRHACEACHLQTGSDFLTGRICSMITMFRPGQNACKHISHGLVQMRELRHALSCCPGNALRAAAAASGAVPEGLFGRRYFTVPRPLLLTVAGAVTGAQGPSYPHGNNITMTAQLTALTNSACCSYAQTRCGNKHEQIIDHVAPAFLSAGIIRALGNRELSFNL